MNKKNIDDNDKIFLWLYAYFKKLSSSKKLCLTFFLPAFIIYIFLNTHKKVRHGNCVWGVCEFFSNRNTLISLSISAKENMMLLLYLEWGVNKRWTSAWFDVRFECSSEVKKAVFAHDAFLTCEIFVRSLNFFFKIKQKFDLCLFDQPHTAHIDSTGIKVIYYCCFHSPASFRTQEIDKCSICDVIFTVLLKWKKRIW